ncbi:pilus assembly protein [Nocardiopsis sp. EMB25]|uniref:TadE family protein n=1 Tax=Nocardiopsis sp. EMB25 TaxID=2835867 RepID=UPI0022833E8B|nr:TadE family protein [Nocardiopsis sp. EMB25]MCY9787104.1 pilus assembly protein [Nocardiopsis sp. EMB25]
MTAEITNVGRRTRHLGDDGHASVFLIMLMPVVAIVFAFVWETGQMLVVKSHLMTAAHEAARAGTHQLDTNATINRGSPVMDDDGARQAASGHLRSEGATGRVYVDGDRVVVLARVTYSPDLLPIGARVIEAQATATALPPR